LLYSIILSAQPIGRHRERTGSAAGATGFLRRRSAWGHCGSATPPLRIIDGIRLCKAQWLRYNNNDMADLEAKQKEASGARFKLIATDGVFSMDGIIADLEAVCDLADEHNALVMVDDSHAVGVLGK
jgi:glycine/serine hydroxymethyltransferase